MTVTVRSSAHILVQKKGYTLLFVLRIFKVCRMCIREEFHWYILCIEPISHCDGNSICDMGDHELNLEERLWLKPLGRDD